MKYRREIDGLRAVAVFPVILFHAGLETFSGGYVGVDVFLVISGYLITSILITELKDERFSIARFYERRARRILPALFFMMACCLPFALALMPPYQLREFSGAMVAVSLFASNFLFWLRTDYFAPAAEENPLLHTWSLAVEEQFYIGFPLLLLALWRFGRNPTLAVIILLSSASLVLTEWGWRNAPAANFYLIFTRAWELGIGAICAFLLHERPVRGNTVLSSFGLGLILLSVFFFDSETPFPSLYALVPVGGTALIVLFASGDTLVGRLLSWRSFVGVGLISYSAYLWHQPLFAFARIWQLSDPGPLMILALVLLTIVLAYFSWRFVEQPFRRRPIPVLGTRSAVFSVSVVVTTVFLAVGLAGHFSNGFVVQRTNSVQMAIYQSATNSPVRELCHHYWPRGRKAVEPCTYHSGPVRWAVLGNSHGVELAFTLANALRSRSEALLHLTVSGCRPAFGLSEVDPNCRNWTDDAVKQIADNPEIAHVVLSYATDGSSEEEVSAYMQMARFLDERGKFVIVVLETPRLPTHIQRLIYVRRPDSHGNVRGQHKLESLKSSMTVRSAVGLLPSSILVIDPFDSFCDATYCYGALEGQGLFFDRHHMSLKGADLVVQQILSEMEQPNARHCKLLTGHSKQY